MPIALIRRRDASQSRPGALREHVYNAGYRRQRSRQYAMRWPRPDDAFLHGARARPVPRSFDL